MSAHVGYGKLILFGEHFVVYKVPAIVAAVNAFTDCTVTPAESGRWTITDNRPEVPGYKPSKKEEQDQSIELVLQHLGVADRPMHITLGGDLVCASGIGASAASCVALARALSAQYGLNLTEEQINAAAFEGEKGYHGTPSGIDNTAATYGGLLLFQRTEGAPSFSPVSVGGTVEIVYASTGITASTTEVVGDVRKLREEQPEQFQKWIAEYEDIVARGKVALAAGDWTAVAGLMRENHALLQKITVSCPELERLVDAALEAGAIGAKMTGTGRGGLIIALTPGKDAQDRVAAALEKVAPHVWKTSIGTA